MSKFLDLDEPKYYTTKVKAIFTEIETFISSIEYITVEINEVLKEVL